MTEGSAGGNSPDVTELLRAFRHGSTEALDRVVPLLYDDLARIAHLQLRREPTGHTLSTTALVHEAYLRLVDQTRAGWADRAHFLGVAAQAMRRVLVDHARRHRAVRRGGPALKRIPIDLLRPSEAAELAGGARADVLLALDDALERLGRLEPRQARVVECRFFGGLTEAETANALGVTARTVARDWVKARGWLLQELAVDD